LSTARTDDYNASPSFIGGGHFSRDEEEPAIAVVEQEQERNGKRPISTLSLGKIMLHDRVRAE
jgi:hypothetical protein